MSVRCFYFVLLYEQTKRPRSAVSCIEGERTLESCAAPSGPGPGRRDRKTEGCDYLTNAASTSVDR
eukprot:1385737-Prymnesium_polylepis.1